jgi:Spy/CpxP family protein refolding chaperone
VKSTLAVALLFFGLLAHAASPGPRDEVAQNLFPPDQVLKYRQDIGLDDRQSQDLKQLVHQAQGRFLDLQWDLGAEAGKLAQLLRAPRVDESAALEQVDRVLSQEREVKKAQLTLLIRVKNLLTPEQQQKLMALREKSP